LRVNLCNDLTIVGRNVAAVVGLAVGLH